MIPIEFRVIWCEYIAGELIPFSGRVRPCFEDCWIEAERKRQAHNYHEVMVEVRVASDKEWPRVWEGR